MGSNERQDEGAFYQCEVFFLFRVLIPKTQEINLPGSCDSCEVLPSKKKIKNAHVFLFSRHVSRCILKATISTRNLEL